MDEQTYLFFSQRFDESQLTRRYNISPGARNAILELLENSPPFPKERMPEALRNFDRLLAAVATDAPRKTEINQFSAQDFRKVLRRLCPLWPFCQ